MNTVLLNETPILDFTNNSIQQLIERNGWRSLSSYDAIGAVYSFVKDEILFGYNRSDDIPASQVLEDGYGQCNTKVTLLMALLRALAIPCRFHGFTIDKELQKGAIPVVLYQIAPQRILHSWVEVYYEGEWLNLEGFIIDSAFLTAIQSIYPYEKGAFCGFGIATPCLQAPQVEWCGKSTYIQNLGIADDFGVFDHPDAFYARYGTNLSGLKRWFYQGIGRRLINWNVDRIRNKR